MLGLSKVRFPSFVFGSAVGFVPGILVFTYLGGNLFEWLLEQPRIAWVTIGITTSLLPLVRYLHSNRGSAVGSRSSEEKLRTVHSPK